MPERIGDIELVETVHPMDGNPTFDLEDSEKVYYQKCTPGMISTANPWDKDSLNCRTMTCVSPDTKLTIVQDRCSKQMPGRCSLWMLWLKFSSFLYLILLILLILWALHQHKVLQERNTGPTQYQVSVSIDSLCLKTRRFISKALLHQGQNIPVREPEIMIWERMPSSYITGTDIKYKNRRYYVSSGGYYEVQCRLQFDTYSGEVPVNDTTIYFSMIKSTGPGSSVNLMSEKATLRPRTHRGIQLGPTVFSLEAGNSVYISVLGHKYVYRTKDSYFAMRRIE
ncbi:uncharacterized protein LOC133197887 [Saccostrea echinata]|uniref:uncharacterized protein LOC133197887 n=1 Tax=Saccostrea echinata TaxID=191078 RepID=UPI002A817D18|nr:uncharacterized protein LOC133197887 [Saccostrea echinata]